VRRVATPGLKTKFVLELDGGSTCRPRKKALPIARRSKKLRLRSMFCATHQRLSRVILLSKVGGRRRVSACAPLHHCHWHWHSNRICTVVFVTRIGERDSFRPNALTCSRRQKCRTDKRGVCCVAQRGAVDNFPYVVTGTSQNRNNPCQAYSNGECYEASGLHRYQLSVCFDALVCG
jgi:hypothetical protein